IAQPVHRPARCAEPELDVPRRRRADRRYPRPRLPAQRRPGNLAAGPGDRRHPAAGGARQAQRQPAQAMGNLRAALARQLSGWGGLKMSALLELKHIHKAYVDLPVLDDVSLSLAPGEVVSLLGPSGCGKSTLLRIAAGLDRDFRGELRLNPQLQPGNGVGVVFQEPRLMPWLSVAQNVGFADGGRAEQPWVQQLLRDVGLGAHAQALPKSLSGGQAQRAAIARGLYGRPQVLLLDEPFSAVDAFTRMKLQDLLGELAARYEIAVLLVTHDLDEAFYLSDRVLILGGTPSRLQRELAVPLARPRDRRSTLLASLRGEALTELYRSHAL